LIVGGHVPFKSARTKLLSLRPASAGYCCSIAALLVFLGSETLQNASADGETRTISFHHIHTKEDLTVTYKRNGRYDEEGLKQINHLMRDWREDEPIKMDPHLIDLLWEVHREVGATEPIRVICGYRSPGTNAKLRRRSSGVAKFSQHMRGNAIDFAIPGVALEDVRAAGLRSQRGGVGYYPSSGFVHMDTGSVRHWPRIPEEQLERVIARGPLNSRLASDNSSGRTVAVAQAAPSRKPAFLAKLFGGNDEEDHAETTAAAKPVTVATAEKPAAKPVAKPAEKLAAVPMPQARPAPVKSESFQLASATAKPAAQPATFQVASATSKTVAVVVTPDTTAVAAAPAKPVATPATYQVASATSQPVRPAHAASLVARADATANDIIADRGFWQGLPSAEPVEAPQTGAARAAAAPRRPAGTAVASADPKTTATVASASLAPWPLAQRTSEVPAPEGSARSKALAYAAQPTPIAHARPAPPMGSGTTKPVAAEPQTTVAVKRSDDRPSVAEPPPPPQRNGVQAVRPGDRFNDPWMRAMIVSPSAQGFMRTTLYGVQDYRSLGPFFQKPPSSIVMTFSQDPHLGMSTEKFAGSAVGFVSTITFKARTAALR
jgi:uncharacterized protein YcbK (DUF882 family)